MKKERNSISEIEVSFVNSLPYQEIPMVFFGTKRFNILYSDFEELLYNFMTSLLEQTDKIFVLREKEVTQIDSHVVRFCKENSERFKLQRYRIDWENKGKAAGYINIQELNQGKEYLDFSNNKIIESPSLFLLLFKSKWDKKKDLIYYEKIREEFESSITFSIFPIPYMFKQVYEFKK